MPDVREMLQSQILVATDFYHSRCSRQMALLDMVADAFGTSLGVPRSTDTVEARQLLALAILKDISRTSRRLLIFAKTNKEAALRIRDKLQQVSGAYDLAITLQLDACVDLINAADSRLRKAPEAIQHAARTRSIETYDILSPVYFSNEDLRQHTVYMLCGIGTSADECGHPRHPKRVIHDSAVLHFQTAIEVHDAPLISVLLELTMETKLGVRLRAILRERLSPGIHRNEHMKTPEMRCASSGDINTLAGLIEEFHESQKVSRHRITALRTFDNRLLEQCLDCGNEIGNTDGIDEYLLSLVVSGSDLTCNQLLKKEAHPNTVEEATGRNALRLACIHGHEEAAEELIHWGADIDERDPRGWLPIELAAYRGLMDVVGLIRDKQRQESRARSSRSPVASPPLRYTKLSPQTHTSWRQAEPVAAESSHLWISLGSNNAEKDDKTITFSKTHSWLRTDDLALETMYCLSVALAGSPEEAVTFDLPALGAKVNQPWYFTTRDPSKAELVIKLFEHDTSAIQGKRLVGSGIMLIGELNANVRPLKESLIREATVPIQDILDFSCIARVKISCFVVNPGPATPPHLNKQSWEFGNGIGGHRGSGKNAKKLKRLQVGENTLQSFTTAVESGASFLEFDVQLTSDLVPVIYHDLLVSETGTDSPMHTLTFEQFEHLSSAQGPRPSRHGRSNSLVAVDREHLDDLAQRMARTNFQKINGFKSNTRGNFIRERSCTLEDVLKLIPTETNFNIELKYPMLFEADDWDMEPLAIKTDVFVDTVLKKVYDHAQGRKIVFSSFSPEICIALSTKQRIWPVFFLSKTSAPRGEVRSSSIQQAIHFAKSWGLPGIVVECSPLIMCPRLIGYIKSAGLACMSFGAWNSNPRCAKLQFDGGIDAVITDSVRAIAAIRETAPDASAKPVQIYP